MSELRPFHKNDHNRQLMNPFQEFDELERRFFEDPFYSFFGKGDIAEFKTDIQDQGDSYLLEADLPGFDKENIHLNLEGDTLTISAERHSQHEESDKKKNYVHVERSYGQYSRSFDVSGIDADGIRARYDNGVLKLTLPKKQETRPQGRTLEIE